MAFKIVDKLTPYNFTNKNSTSRIKYIVIHYYGSLGTAKAIANYFASAYRGASAHYSLDEGEIVYRCVLEEDIAWHCGTSKEYKHPYCRNSNSLGIEVRPYKVDTSRAAYASDRDWYFTDEVMDRLVEFTVHLMKEHNVPPENVLRHYDVTGKLCPRPLVGSDTNTVYKDTGDHQWQLFKERIAAAFNGEDYSASSSVEETEYNAVGEVTAFFLNVRKGAGTHYGIVKSVEMGSELNIVAQTSNGWYKLDSGYYVHKDYVKITEEDDDMAKMTQEEFNAMMNTWLEQQSNRTDTWIGEDVKQFIQENNIFSGDGSGRMMYKKPITREEVAVVLYKTYKVIINTVKNLIKK